MKKLSKYLLLLLPILLLVQGVRALNPIQNNEEANIDTTDGPRLKVLSWNIYMLPKIVVRKGKRERATAIAAELKKSDFDIIVFQEAFLPAARAIIKKSLDSIYKFQYGPINDTKGINTNGGVWVISKIELKELGTIKFEDCKGFDCYANKGAIMLQGVFNNKPFQILGTHLQADGYDKIRNKQMDQIYAELISKYKTDSVPQIVCGDMNTENEIREHYCQMLKCLDAEDGDFSSVEKETYDGVNNEIAQKYGVHHKLSLDYILLRTNGAKMKSVKRFVSILQKGKKHLSDHYGVVCELKF